jgi:hypothetical protein
MDQYCRRYVWVCLDIVQPPPSALHTCTRSEQTWISIVDRMTGVCQNVPAIVIHPSTVDSVRSLASGCFWLDYVDGIVDVVKAPQTWLEALELWRSEQPMEIL